jgi:ribose/xylose/arabinose/galactoside ABC-type transport system permease subunit
VLEFSLNTLVPNAYVIMLIEGLVIVAILFLDSYDNKRKRERV